MGRVTGGDHPFVHRIDRRRGAHVEGQGDAVPACRNGESGIERADGVDRVPGEGRASTQISRDDLADFLIT
ncbi:hypothetical protein ACIPVB_12255 [Microbacterium sp. NPDC090007]|uniref:hypothetical protein n=1 Tax=Microbacterium sp. NPDC090007 TaxID=3364204 RepID=UPI0037F556D6